MPYKTGVWGEQARQRSKKRLDYFRKANKFHFRRHNHLKIKGEKIARELMPFCKYVDERAYDFMWESSRVEVKAANKQKNKYWYFHITNSDQLIYSDYFLLIYLENDELVGADLVPTEEITAKKSIASNLNRYKEYNVWRCLK